VSPRRRWRRSDWLGPLGLRLTGAAVIIALVSVVLMASLTVLLADLDLTNAGHEFESTSTRAIVDSVRSTYVRDPDWKPADLATTEDLARSIGVGVVLKVNGTLYMKVPAPAGGGTSKTVSVTVSGRTIGVVTITFARSGLLPEELAFRRSIERSILLAAGLALLVALVAAVYGSRWLVTPLRSLIAATRRLASGDRSSRVGEVPTTGAMAELAAAFDSMAEKLEREDALRQNIVADLAHELRTPLSILQGQLEGLAVGVSPLDQDAVASLSEEVARLARLIEDLQVLSSA
jgi:signal transduction histidine kinase